MQWLRRFSNVPDKAMAGRREPNFSLKILNVCVYFIDNKKIYTQFYAEKVWLPLYVPELLKKS